MEFLVRKQGRRLRHLGCLLLLATVLASCSLQKYGLFPSRASTFQNPHTACVRCHGIETPGAGQALFPSGDDPSDLCLACHSYAQNHHPVNFAPLTTLPPSFPLYGKKIKCLTCHEIHGGPRHEGSSKLLRGGPYVDRRTICFKCHLNEQYADIDPHMMLDSSGKVREVNGKPVCLLCHEVKPDPTQDKESNVYFRADIGFLCWRCHPPMPGSFDSQHFLVRPSKETMAYITSPEIQEKYTLPLVPWGRINCSTCHNPHQAGVILYKPAAAGADSPHRLRAPNLCAACHNY